MNKWIPISVWILVVILAIWVYFKPKRAVETPTVADGRVFVEVPWQHLPPVGDFRLVNQNNEPFSSAAETGHPYLVNFFFSTCPTICRQFNGKMKTLLDQYEGTDLEVVSITVDAEQDTPQLLKRYAESFQADERWQFLTGQPYLVKQTGNFVFHVPLEKATHTEKIILVDRWGKIRDWFDWNDPQETARLKETVDTVLAEKAPPFDLTVSTRYAYAGKLASLWKTQDWIREFELTDTDGQDFYSPAMTGKVWVASFFFSTCPGICQVQNRHLANYQSRLKQMNIPLISISTTPTIDTPVVLRDYARQFVQEPEIWKFTTPESDLHVQRIASEFFGASAGAGHHSSRLFVVDKWGNVRGDFDWQIPEQEKQFWDMLEQLNQETVPPQQWERLRAGETKPSLPDDEADEESEAPDVTDDSDEDADPAALAREPASSSAA